MKRITHILLDNGHGSDTPGKESPVWSDGRQVFEWEYTRRLVSAISAKLAESGIPVRIITPETTDTPLYIRVNRVNQIARSVGAGSCLLVSVHLNAARETNTGSGWEVHTSLGSTASDIYADQFWDAANKEIGPLTRMRGDYSDGDRDWVMAPAMHLSVQAQAGTSIPAASIAASRSASSTMLKKYVSYCSPSSSTGLS